MGNRGERSWQVGRPFGETSGSGRVLRLPFAQRRGDDAKGRLRTRLSSSGKTGKNRFFRRRRAVLSGCVGRGKRFGDRGWPDCWKRSSSSGTGSVVGTLRTSVVSGTGDAWHGLAPPRRFAQGGAGRGGWPGREFGASGFPVLEVPVWDRPLPGMEPEVGWRGITSRRMETPREGSIPTRGVYREKNRQRRIRSWTDPAPRRRRARARSVGISGRAGVSPCRLGGG